MSYPSAEEQSSPAVVATEKRKLQKSLGRWDVLACLLCSLVGIDAYGAVATYGAQAFTWLLFLAIVYFIPYALITAEAGSAFVEEGGPYIWMRLAFGRLAASIGTAFYWSSNAVWLGGSLVLTGMAAYSTFISKIPNGSWGAYVFGVLFVWFAVLSAILSINVGKWVPIVGAVARLIVIPFFTISVVLFALKHGVHGFKMHDFAPTYPKFLGAIPLLYFDLAGFEVPNAAGEEIKHPQRDVIFGIMRSAIGTILLYGIPMLAILIVVPQKQINGLSGFLDAIKFVLTIWGGHISPDGVATLTGAGKVFGWIMGSLTILILASSGAVWIMGADRIQAIAALDGAGPLWLGRFSARFGTPTAVNLCSGVLATFFTLFAIHTSATSTGGQNSSFQIMLNLAVSVSTIAYLFIFPAFVRLRYLHPEVERPYRVPGGNYGIWLCGILTMFWTVFAILTEVWTGFGAGWFGTPGTPDAALPKGFDRFHYELAQFVPLTAIVGIGVLFYLIGRRNLRAGARL
jgi:amino acid transporter